jgi:hypothetical protein
MRLLRLVAIRLRGDTVVTATSALDHPHEVAATCTNRYAATEHSVDR